MRATDLLRKKAALLALTLLLAPVSAGADSHAQGAAAVEGDAAAEAPKNPDPWEGFNRKVFAFNEGVDGWVLEPVAIAWDFVFPDPIQTAIRNVYNNLLFPVIFVNNILQLKPVAAVKDVGRFTVNTVIGLAGLWDPAKHMGMPANDEDFGQTLGYWGVPPGPYLVLPFFGPSSPRDAFGMGGNVAIGFGAWYAVGVPIYGSIAITAIDIINRRSLLIDEIREERKAALDFYVFVRNAYMQNRAKKVRDAIGELVDAEGAEDDLYEEDLYYLDDESTAP